MQEQQVMETMRSTRSPKKEGTERPRIDTDESVPNMTSEESVLIEEYDIPQFSPFHLRADQVVIPPRPVSPEEKEIVIKSPEVKKVPTPVQIKPVVTRYRPQMDDSHKVLNFVDKQVRKELFLSIKSGNIPLLTNFVNQFGKSMTSRQGQINYQSEYTGNTILHLALFLNYEKKSISIDLDDEQSNTPSAIKQALSKESETSQQIKFQVVQLLIDNAGSDPRIQNRYGMDAHAIAKCLNTK